MNPKSMAEKIVGMISDGRMTYPLIEALGFYVAMFICNTESESKVLAFCHSVIENVKERNADYAEW